jgi:hypothetical protein
VCAHPSRPSLTRLSAPAPRPAAGCPHRRTGSVGRRVFRDPVHIPFQQNRSSRSLSSWESSYAARSLKIGVSTQHSRFDGRLDLASRCRNKVVGRQTLAQRQESIPGFSATHSILIAVAQVGHVPARLGVASAASHSVAAPPVPAATCSFLRGLGRAALYKGRSFNSVALEK